jgi:putative tryptophan/tyrosine transport system substrate-binding protein
MRRRDFIAGAAASAGLAPLRARAQSKKVPVVGVVWHAASEQEEEPFLEPFRASLRQLGYVEGKNIALELRFPAERPELFESMAHELVERRVDVLVAVSPLAAAAAKRATSTIPIVFVTHPNPVEAGIVASLAHPGGNVTGFSNLIGELGGKQIELLREIIPGLKRVAVLVMPAFGPAGPRFAGEATAASVRLGVEAIRHDVTTPDDFDRTFAELRSRGVDAVILAPTSIFFPERERIAKIAIAHRLPTIGVNEVMVRSGLFLWYGPNFQNLFRQAAHYVDRILKGANPAELPVQQPTKLELVINLASARAMGLDLPPAVLARADEVVE